MRLFVGVTLAEHVRAAADGVVRKLRRRLDERVRVSWVPLEKMHVTVRFIGQVSDEAGQQIVDALRPPIHVVAFELALDHCGVFPSHGSPHVLWIGLEEGFASLQAIHDELNARLRPLGLAPEDRPFTAHLTLARVKHAPRRSGAWVREALQDIAVPPARCPIDQVTVFSSRLSPRGSTYTPVIHIPLSSG